MLMRSAGIALNRQRMHLFPEQAAIVPQNF